MHHPLRQSNFPCYFVSIAILCMIFSAVTLDLYRQPATKESHIPESAEVFASAIELKIPNFTQPQATIEATQEDTAYLYDNISFAPELQELLWCACEETGCPYELALSVIWCETRFRNVNGDWRKQHWVYANTAQMAQSKNGKIGSCRFIRPAFQFSCWL